MHIFSLMNVAYIMGFLYLCIEETTKNRLSALLCFVSS